MAERRRLGRVARRRRRCRRDGCARGSPSAAADPSPPRGSRAPSATPADDRESGDRRECSRGRRRRRETPPPADRRPASAAAAAAPCARRASRGTASEIVAFHRQRVWKTGASRNAWTSTSRTVRRVQVAEDVGERERVLRAERQQQALFGGGRLQLEVELPAEALAQRQRPGAVHAAAERRVQHQLHAARLVEEPLEDERLLRRQRAEHAPRVGQVRRRPAPPRPRRRPRRDQPRRRRPPAAPRVGSEIAARSRAADSLTAARQLRAARRRLAEPERQRRRRPVRVGDADDAASRPAGCATSCCPAGRRRRRLLSMAKSSLSVPIEQIVGLEQHAIVGVVGDGAARGERGQPGGRGAPSSAAAAPRRGGRARRAGPRRVVNPLASMPTTASKSRARQVAIRPGAAHQRERDRPRATRRRRSRRRSAAPARRAARRRRSDRSSSPSRTARSSATHSTRSSRDIGNRRPLGVPAIVWPARPTRCRNVAMRCGEPIWHTRSTWPMSMPSSSDAVATSAFSSPRFSRCFGVEAALLRQAAVMRGDGVLAEPLGQVPRHALGHLARVDEHQRRPMLARSARPGDRSTPPTPRATSPPRAAMPAARSRDRVARRWPSSTIAQSARPSASTLGVPTRKRATSSIGRCVADRPIRCTGCSRSRARAARATAPGARRAACRSPRGSRRRSPSARAAAARGCAPAVSSR